MKSIVTLVVVFALAIIIVIARLWRDLRRGGSLFHWSPGGTGSDEENLKVPLIKKQ
jgi:hypothetical protein